MAERDLRWWGTVLVWLQFALLGVWAVALFVVPLPALSWGALVAGIVLGVWALCAHPLRQLTAHPLPRRTAQLIAEGPYRWIRHPMYAAVLLATLSLPLADPIFWWHWVAVFGVLHGKIAIEERVWAARDPAYRAYAARTGRLLPRMQHARKEDKDVR